MIKRVHFLGIGGSGASAAGAIAKSQGFEVTGCDKDIDNEFTSIFTKDALFEGHNPNHLENVDILAITPAITSLDPKNLELLEAKKLGIKIMTWQQFAGEYLTKNKFVIAICGTHGKTTTTAMIAQILEDADLDPTVLLGAINPKWKANYRIGSNRHPELVSGSHGIPKQVRNDKKHEYFVIEADEFNDNFLHHFPNITVVTNIEMDHPEYFKDLNAYLNSFEKFLLQTKQTIVANLTDRSVAEILKDVMKKSPVTSVDFTKSEMDFNLQIPGSHNILNAKAAMQVGLLLGISPQIIRTSLNNYTGVERRFEYLGDFKEALVYSDFGHHPTEVKKTMEAAREKFPNQKIWLFYQPHMFSRTKALFDDFVKVFQDLEVDGVVILDIYPSREIDTGLVSSQELVRAINEKHVHYAKELKKEEFEQYSKPKDILFFMGAGDIDKLAKKLCAGNVSN